MIGACIFVTANETRNDVDGLTHTKHVHSIQQLPGLDDLLVHDVYDILTKVIIFPIEFIFAASILHQTIYEIKTDVFRFNLFKRSRRGFVQCLENGYLILGPRREKTCLRWFAKTQAQTNLRIRAV